MNIRLNEEQEMLKKAARSFLEKECPRSLVRELEISDSGYSPELWRKMAELGWLGLVFPEKCGGMGGNFLDSAVLHEEMGRAALPGPYLSTVDMCGQVLLACGSDEQKTEFIKKIISGDMVLAMALTEPNASWYVGSIVTRATPDGGDYIINGTKLFVTYGNIADYLLCVARTPDEKAKEDGISLFLVNAKSHGITSTPLKTMGGDKQDEINFSGVRVPKRNMLGQMNMGKRVLTEALRPAVLMQCAEMVGAAQLVLEMSLDYAKQRVQFGRPIGSFQAIQHKCADMAVDVEGARLITWAAAWKLSKGFPCAKDVSMAKAYVNAACRRVAWEGHQIHAGIAFLKDHDLQLYSRRAMASEYNLGDTEFHQQIIAREMGLTS